MSIYAHSKPGSHMSDWQTLQDHCKAVADMAVSDAIGQDAAPSQVSSHQVGHDQIRETSDRPLIAHVDPNDPNRTEPLTEHLLAVQDEAQRFGSRFGCGELAKFLGGIHDFGKAAQNVQEYLWSAAGECSEYDEAEEAVKEPKNIRKRGPDHSSAGGQFSERALPGLGLLLAYAATGHHTGLPDGIGSSQSSLENRLQKELPDWEAVGRQQLPSNLFEYNCTEIRNGVTPFLLHGDGYSLAFLTRMLFSCLVDADFIATERFMDKERADERESITGRDFVSLQAILDAYFDKLAAKVLASGTADTPVNVIREEVRVDCVSAASLPPGLFTLTVPTGGGKTLSSMAFALRHAAAHGLDRVIYVIPYTSIIEQNAKVFRDIFGDDIVLEHHGNVDYEARDSRMRFLAENWDAPIIVTTSVQFFESLHSNRTSSCRKLHNLARSVVILDEAQSLPIDLLKPCLRALDELVCRYGTSVVLCTATQPAVLSGQLAKGGLTGGKFGCREIIPAERRLHERLRRVVAELLPGKVSDADLLELAAERPSALVIVNTRRHAREMFESARARFPDRTVFHLSAQMCPQHRTEILSSVKRLLCVGEPCLLISTQLIEAGVDIDFPCVFREMSGADSLSQAAGRCNREGRLSGPGRVFFFESAENHSPPGFLATAAAKGKEVLSLEEFKDDLLAPDLVTRYFELLYDSLKSNLDRLSVLSDLIPSAMPKDHDSFLVYKFRTLGERFHLISEPSISVFIPYGEEGWRLCEELRRTYATGEQRKIARELQRYAVSLRGPEPRDEDGNLMAELVHDTWWVLPNVEQYYDRDYGVCKQAKNNLLDI